MTHASSRVLYHAPGDGLGHLVRAAWFLRTYFSDSELILSSNSSYLSDHRLKHFLPDQTSLLPLPSHRSVPASSWQALLQRPIYDGLTHLCIDVFPLGLQGELLGLHLPSSVQVWLISRRLKWAAYRAHLGDTMAQPPPFSSPCRQLVLEPLETEHEAFLMRLGSGSITCPTPIRSRITLTPAAREPLPAPVQEALDSVTQPPWLIVHSGGREELEALVGYAHDLRTLEGHEGPLWLVTPEPLTDTSWLSPEVRCLSLWPVEALFAPAHRIVTACGFNLMQELRPWRYKHHFMPLPRRFDDQHWRARWHRTHPPA